MERQLSLSDTPLLPPSSSDLGLSETACNECKRRKGRCDRQLPECGPCERNKRHCLYEKHSKTPLTRKHLTSVEEKLRQAELRARQLERRVQAAEAKLQQDAAKSAEQNYPTNIKQSPDSSAALASPLFSSVPETGFFNADPRLRQKQFAASAQVAESSGPRSSDSISPGWQQIGHHIGSLGSDNEAFGSPLYPESSGDSGLRSHELEMAPTDADDFSWDETTIELPEGRPDGNTPEAGDEDETGVADGMAMLSVDEKGAGYLGVSSGTAMLRMLLPDAEHRRSIRRAKIGGIGTMPSVEEDGYGWVPTPVFEDRNIGEIDLDQAVNAYFSLFHLSYPLVHEPSFRAQYSQVVPRPSGKHWNALAYMIGAIGLFTTANGSDARDLDLFEAAKANLDMDCLETGNLTLVQVLMLMANYIQKRGKPNSGYNYLGLALHISMGLGLHKEFHNWRISPLAMEIRRRVWWCLTCFYVGAVITFGRPLSWPSFGVEVSIPLNVDDRDLTNVSTSLPPPKPGITAYSAIAAQARFHLATNEIYTRVISVNFPSAAELLLLDDRRIEPWRAAWQDNRPPVPARFRLSQLVLEWRFRNFRIIMYRPFVIRQVLASRTKQAPGPPDPATQKAIYRCLDEAKASIASIHDYWTTGHRTSMASWYALYFLFQASLIPCVCLRNSPAAEQAAEWRTQIETVLNVLDSMHSINLSSRECRQVINRLCGDYLVVSHGTTDSGNQIETYPIQPVEESPQTQLSGVYSMMWPSANSADVDIMMPDSSWASFLNDVQSTTPFLPDDQHNSYSPTWGHAMPGGMPGDMPGSMSGNMPGGMAGGMPGSMPTSFPRSTPPGGHGPGPGYMPGGNG
jgi:transcriptional regulatory protein GAL4